MKKIFYTAFYFCSALLMSSCIGDLDQYPHEEETSSTIYTSAANYKAVLGKIYAAMVTTGQEKNGDNDLSSNSGQDYMRCFFNLQECGTDEVASTWLSGDNVTGLTYLSWDANDPWVSDMYYRIYYNIALCNEFLRNATDEKIAQFTDQEQTEIRIYRAEARFMRALFYYHALDLFRNIPFVTEKNKKIIGVLENYDEQKEKEAEIEHHLKNINKIQKASQRDFLTGVYNREGLIQNIEKALKEDKNKQGVDAFFILDLDHFKEINDFLGHGTGDQVLQNTAKILDQCFRKEDIVGRLGGDEFVLLIRRIDRIEAVHRMAKKLNESLCNTYEKDGQRIQISASIGIALGQAETESFEKLYEKADEALYEVKREQKNGYKIYEGQSRV